MHIQIMRISVDDFVQCRNQRRIAYCLSTQNISIISKLTISSTYACNRSILSDSLPIMLLYVYIMDVYFSAIMICNDKRNTLYLHGIKVTRIVLSCVSLHSNMIHSTQIQSNLISCKGHHASPTRRAFFSGGVVIYRFFHMAAVWNKVVNILSAIFMRIFVFDRQNILIVLIEHMFVPECPVNSKPALVQINAGYLTGHKLLPESIISRYLVPCCVNWQQGYAHNYYNSYCNYVCNTCSICNKALFFSFHHIIIYHSLQWYILHKSNFA